MTCQGHLQGEQRQGWQAVFTREDTGLGLLLACLSTCWYQPGDWWEDLWPSAFQTPAKPHTEDSCFGQMGF